MCGADLYQRNPYRCQAGRIWSSPILQPSRRADRGLPSAVNVLADGGVRCQIKSSDFLPNDQTLMSGPIDVWMRCREGRWGALAAVGWRSEAQWSHGNVALKASCEIHRTLPAEDRFIWRARGLLTESGCFRHFTSLCLNAASLRRRPWLRYSSKSLHI